MVNFNECNYICIGLHENPSKINECEDYSSTFPLFYLSEFTIINNYAIMDSIYL